MTMMNILIDSAKVSAVYCTYLFALHYVVIVTSSALLGTNYDKTLNKKNKKVWHNKAVSIIHAITMFALVMHYWIGVNPSMSMPEKVGVHEARCLDFMMGYLWYDSLWEIFSDGQVDTLGHHILGLISHLSTRLSDNGASGFYR